MFSHFSGGSATPFMMAIQEGNIDILKLLYKEGSIDQKNDQGKNVFHFAFDSRKPVEAANFLKNATEKGRSITDSKMKELLTAKDTTQSQDTPFHILAQRNLDLDTFKELFKQLGIVLECLKEKNALKETPLHIAARQDRKMFVRAVLNLGEDNPKIEELLVAKDKDSNTPLHLATCKKRPDCPSLLLFLKKTRNPVKYFVTENSFGVTPFSGAVEAGNTAIVDEMLKKLTSTQTNTLVSHHDSSKKSLLYMAAEKGYVGIFNLLLDNGAQITKREEDHKTALQIAIEKDQRGVIDSIIKSLKWKEAFKLPCSSSKGNFETPFRMLIKQFPDLAEKFLDVCCEKDESDDSETNQDEIKINYDFIEDTSCFLKSKSKEGQFFHKDEIPGDDLGSFTKHKVVIENHPLIIMANEKQVELLQHPVCSVITERKWDKYGFKSYLLLIAVYVIFLIALNLFILTSPSPIDSPESFNCTEFFSRANTEYRKNNSVKTDNEGTNNFTKGIGEEPFSFKTSKTEDTTKTEDKDARSRLAKCMYRLDLGTKKCR